MPAPQYCPTPRELDDLELLLSGALAPRSTFDVSDPGITLALPPELADAPEVELVDPEGLPLALFVLGGRAASEASGQSRPGLTPLAHPTYGPFRRLHLTPAQALAHYDGALTVPVAAPLTAQDLGLIRDRAAGRDVVLLALSGTGTPQHVSPVGLVRATLAAATLLGIEGVAAHVVAVPLPSHGDPEYDHALGQQVAATRRMGAIGAQVYAPSSRLATDNAGMIARAGLFHFESGRRARLDLNAYASLPLPGLIA